MGTHGFSENSCLYPPKTRTHDQGYGFLRVRVQVWAEIPQGYPWQSLTTTQHNSNLPASHHSSCHNNRLAGSFDGDSGVGRCRRNQW